MLSLKNCHLSKFFILLISSRPLNEVFFLSATEFLIHTTFYDGMYRSTEEKNFFSRSFVAYGCCWWLRIYIEPWRKLSWYHRTEIQPVWSFPLSFTLNSLTKLSASLSQNFWQHTNFLHKFYTSIIFSIHSPKNILKSVLCRPTKHENFSRRRENLQLLNTQPAKQQSSVVSGMASIFFLTNV